MNDHNNSGSNSYTDMLRNIQPSYVVGALIVIGVAYYGFTRFYVSASVEEVVQ